MSRNLTPHQLKVLSLYAMLLAGGVMPKTSLVDCISECDVSVLPLSEAVGILCEDGHLLAREDKGEVFLTLAQSGKIIATELAKDVPVTVRELCAVSVMREMSRLREQASVSCDVREVPDGFSVDAALTDGGTELLRFSLYAPTRFQADILSKQFRDHPAETYKKLIDALIAAPSQKE